MSQSFWYTRYSIQDIAPSETPFIMDKFSDMKDLMYYMRKSLDDTPLKQDEQFDKKN
jgi:hypothetical protein